MPIDAVHPAVRLFHFSDIHVAVDRPGWQLGDWTNKRLPGWLNLRGLGRGKRFANADQVLRRFRQDVQEYRPDCLVFSGDASGLGFEKEVAQAAMILGVADEEGVLGIA